MSDKSHHLDSLFEAALQIESVSERAAFLDESCGEDRELRNQLDRLLASDAQAGSFMSTPIAEAEATFIGQSQGDRAASLDAGLVSAFHEGDAVVVGSAGHSVLKSLGLTGAVPHVVLRDSPAEANEPITRPKSPEMPAKSDSRYQLQGEIARGGMGAIIKGRDTDLGRDLAIKVLLDQHKSKPDVIQRFIEEAQIGGQLQHPGIAPVYELGQFSDQRPFFSMKLVKGETLSKLLSERRNPTEDRARFLGIFEQICQTMAYAHSRGVIHRDLKPANIMVGAFGEVQVMDWGLAKVLPAGGVADEKKALTKTHGQSVIQTLRTGVGSDMPVVGSVGSQTQMGSVMGTPAYMPPEQALGEIDNLDERADVFGLGAILCEILTGKPPYVADDGTQVFRMASRGKLTECFERLENCQADTELVGIARQCLEPEPADRPRDANVLAGRMTAYLESVESRLRSAEIERATAAARAEEALHTAREHESAARAERHARKLQFGLALIVAGVLAVGGFAATWAAIVQSQLKRDARLAENQANAARESANSAREKESDQRKRAQQEETRAKAATARAEAEKIGSLNMLADMQTERGLLASRGGLSAEAALWFANAALLTPHDPDRQHANEIRAASWEQDSVKPVSLLKVGEGVQWFAFSSDGVLAVTVSNSQLRVWDWRNEVVFPWSEKLTGVQRAIWSPDGQQLAIVKESGMVDIVAPYSGQVRCEFKAHEGPRVAVWSPDGTRLAVAAHDVQVWRIAEEPQLEFDWPHPGWVYGVNFSRSGTRLVTACDDNLARVYSLTESTAPAPMFPGIEHAPFTGKYEATPVFCENDRRLVTAIKPNDLAFWDSESGTRISPEKQLARRGSDFCLTVSPDGRWIAAGGGQWCSLFSTDGEYHELRHFNHVQTATFSPDGRSLLTTCYDGTARQWPLHDQGEGKLGIGSPTPIPEQSTFARGAYSQDGQHLAVATDSQVIIWERPTAPYLLGQVAWQGTLWYPEASPNQQLVAPSSRPLGWHAQPVGLSIVRIEDGRPAGPEIQLKAPLYDSCICSDNASVAALCDTGTQGTVTIYDIASGIQKFPTIELPSLPLGIAARQKHSQIAAVCQDGELVLIDSLTGTITANLKHELWQQREPMFQMAYSPDDATLVTVSPNNLVYIRDGETGELRIPPIDPVVQYGPCRAIAISPDSKFLATAVCGKNMAQVWDLSNGEKVGTAMPHPGDMYGLWCLQFSPDGKLLLTGHKDGRIRVWDWQTGTLVGAPMQNPDEVFDVRLTPNGRQLLAAVRHSPLQVWDFTTRKLAAPPVASIVPPYASSDSVIVAGDRALVTAGAKYSLLQLSSLLPKPEQKLPEMINRLELATNQKNQLGELAPLELSEWNVRWDRQVESRMPPEKVAEDMANELDQADSSEIRRLIARRAVRLRQLDRLLELRPGTIELQLAKAEELDRMGESGNARKMRRNIAAYAQQVLAEGTRLEPSLTTLLAQQLAVDAVLPDFKPLDIDSVSAESGCEFSRLPDDSMLAGPAETPNGDSYTVSCRNVNGHIAALRLEVLNDTSLPNQGTGWGAGNFHLTEIHAQLQRADGTRISLKFREAASDYARPASPASTFHDGPWGAIDGNQTTRWDVWPNPQIPRMLVLSLTEPVDVIEGDELIIQMDFRDPVWKQARLGRFRLSVSDSKSVCRDLQLKLAVERGVLSDFNAMAACSLLRNDTEGALRWLDRGESPLKSSADLTVQALTEQAAGQLEAAKLSCAELTKALEAGGTTTDLQGLQLTLLTTIGGLTPRQFYAPLEQPGIDAELSRLSALVETQPASLDYRYARSHYLASLGRWSESVVDLEEIVRLAPDARSTWADICAKRALAGDREAYIATCQRMRQHFQSTNSPDVADSVCKANLLLPGIVETTDLPEKLLLDGLTDPQRMGGHYWYVGSSGLVALRAGNPEEALKRTAELNENKYTRALGLVVRAIAQHQLGKIDEAADSLRAAEDLIPPDLRQLGAEDYNGPLPVATSSVQHDWLIPEILRREAESLIR